MKLWRGSARTAIGVDLGAKTIKAAQLVASATGWQLAAAVEYVRPVRGGTSAGLSVGAEETKLLADVLERRGFTGRRVVIAAPASQLFTTVLELPPRASGAPVDQIAHAEVARMAKLEPGGFESSQWELPAAARAGSTTSALAVAMSHAHAEAIIRVFEANGLQIERIDTQSWALARGCAAALEAPPAITGTLDLGWDATRLNLMLAGEVIFHRALSDSGVSTLWRSAVKAMEMSDQALLELFYPAATAQQGQTSPLFDPLVSARARQLVERFVDGLTTELEASFTYAAHRYGRNPVGEVLLVGGGARLPGLAERLAGKHGMRVRVMELAQAVHIPEAMKVHAPSSLLLAAGLAIPVEEA